MGSASNRRDTVRYKYDALGRRVQRAVAGGPENTKFTYDGEDVLVDDNGGTLTKYINGDGIDEKLSARTGTDVRYFLADHLGSTNGLADANGSLTASTTYDAFGIATNTNFPTRYQFTGREFDSFTGLQFSRARHYDPKIGRFISEDPIGFAGGDINLYGYVWNNPQHFTDPMGLSPWSDWAAWANEGRWRGEQAVISFFAPLFEGAIGFGDNASFGASRWFRQWQGFDDSYLDCSAAYQAGGWAGLAVDAATGIGGAAKLGLQFAAKRGAKTRFPKNPDDLLPDLPRNSKGQIFPSDKVRIRPEKHAPKPGEAGYNPRHHGQHYHVEIRIDTSKSWKNKKNTRKVYPPGYKKGGGSGFKPGEKFPGL